MYYHRIIMMILNTSLSLLFLLYSSTGLLFLYTGIIPGDPATRSMLISKISDLRGTLGGVGDSLDGRIPIAYAHFVQLIVDIFLALAPFALYSELGIWSVPAVGILNIFYSGMLDLAKILLDPLDNSDFYKNSMVNMDIGMCDV